MTTTPPTTTSAAEPREPLWSNDRIGRYVANHQYEAGGRIYDIVLNNFDVREIMKEMRDDMQARIDELAVALVVEQAQVAELQEQLAEARGDSGPNPIVEWKGWKVELDFGEEGNDE